MTEPSDPLVNAAWLNAHLRDPDLRIVDATWFMPNDGRNARAEHMKKRIPGAVFFDIDEISDTSSALPHMLPAPAEFAARVGELGIVDGQRIVAYDAQGMFSAARVWWMFRAMGHDGVFVLDGGLPAWERAGYPCECGAPNAPKPTSFTPRFRAGLVRDLSYMRQAMRGGALIFDARPAGRFAGRDPEPRAGLRAGHIPGAQSLPFGALLNADKTFKSKSELDALFAARGVAPEAELVATCGSGVTAAIIALALARIGRWDTAVYDGSWAEWGGREDTPIEMGEAE